MTMSEQTVVIDAVTEFCQARGRLAA
jgi:hypothetical protein